MQAALQTIGEAIIEDEYTTEYQPYYTASPISGSNKAIQSVVVLQFERTGDRMEYLGTDLIDSTEGPEETATTFGYVYSSGKTDNSVTKRCTESRSVNDRYPALVGWFDPDVLGDELLSDPDIAGVQSILSEDAGSTHEEVKQDVDNVAQRVDYRAFITLSITKDGEEHYVGDLEAYNEGMKKWASDDLKTKSTAKNSYGFARCSVCDEETECYGLGAKMGQQYAVKQQWPFPSVNSSDAWRRRPLCIDCINAIEVATDRFLDAQEYGVPPDIHCRVIPYALPMPGGTEQLKALIRNARFELSGATDEDAGDDEEEDESGNERPLSTAWDAYRNAVEMNDEQDALRLAFSHVVYESTKTHGVAWIDGVSVDQVVRLQTGIENLYENDPVFEQGLLPSPDPPTERQIFTGNWLFWLLAGTRDSDHRGQYVGDETPWAEYTERVLTGEKINYGDLISVFMREVRARYRDRLGEDTDFPYDGFHLAATYGLLRFMSAQGIVRDYRTETNNNEAEETDTAMTMNGIDGSYTKFGDGVQEFIKAHPSIDNSPGRTAAFALGAAAAQLSAWQAMKGRSKTFVQNRDPEKLTEKTLKRWQTDLWEKAKIYNSQMGNYGIPWSGVESTFHEATLSGENEGWKASADEIRYHYVLGINVGPKISDRAEQNYEKEQLMDESDETISPTEPQFDEFREEVESENNSTSENTTETQQ